MYNNNICKQKSKIVLWLLTRWTPGTTRSGRPSSISVRRGLSDRSLSLSAGQTVIIIIDNHCLMIRPDCEVCSPHTIPPLSGIRTTVWRRASLGSTWPWSFRSETSRWRGPTTTSPPTRRSRTCCRSGAARCSPSSTGWATTWAGGRPSRRTGSATYQETLSPSFDHHANTQGSNSVAFCKICIKHIKECTFVDQLRRKSDFTMSSSCCLLIWPRSLLCKSNKQSPLI